MKVIGITGGMASGKSTLARMIAERGIPHIDADQLVHALMERPDIAAAIEAAFPGTTAQEKVDRKALGLAVAGNAEKLASLEAILHPAVRTAEEAAIAQAQREGASALLLDIPLLFETGADALCDVVIVAHAPETIRRARARARGMPEATIERLLARQWSDAQRNARGDVVIDTAADLAQTRAAIDAVLADWKLV